MLVHLGERGFDRGLEEKKFCNSHVGGEDMENQQVSSSQSESIQNIQWAGRSISSKVEGLSPDLFLTGAAVSIGLSLLLRGTGRHHDAQFVGQWAPTLLLLGLYTREGRGVRTVAARLQSGASSEERGMH